MILEVSTTIWLPDAWMAKRSRPRGAGPSLYSPAWLYLEPWHGHSHHWAVAHQGTRQPRGTQRWYRATNTPPAPAVHTALVQGQEPAPGDAGVEALGVVRLVVGDQVEAAVGDVGVAVVGLDIGLDLVGVAGLDLGAEALGQVGPQEVDAAGAEPGHGRPGPGQPGRAQERPPAHLWLLGRRPGTGRADPLRDRHRFPSWIS